MLRTFRQQWHKHRLVMRHTSWPSVPSVAVRGAADLLRTSAANVLRSAGKSSLAISSGLEALLLAERSVDLTDLSPAESALRGVGGLARETKRGVQQTLIRLGDAAGYPDGQLPEPLQSVLAVALLPWGVGRGLQRLALLLTLGMLGGTRSAADAFRALLGPSDAEPGRARPPRPPNSLPLYPMCSLVAISVAGRAAGGGARRSGGGGGRGSDDDEDRDDEGDDMRFRESSWGPGFASPRPRKGGGGGNASASSMPGSSPAVDGSDGDGDGGGTEGGTSANASAATTDADGGGGGDSATDGAGAQLVIAATLAPRGSLVLTQSSLRCVGPPPAQPSLWEVSLRHLLLVQQRGTHVRLLALVTPAAAATSPGIGAVSGIGVSGVDSHGVGVGVGVGVGGGGGGDAGGGGVGSSGGGGLSGPLVTVAHEVALGSEDEAGRLHEVLRLAGLNAKGLAAPPPCPRPLLRTTLLEACHF